MKISAVWSCRAIVCAAESPLMPLPIMRASYVICEGSGLVIMVLEHCYRDAEYWVGEAICKQCWM